MRAKLSALLLLLCLVLAAKAEGERPRIDLVSWLAGSWKGEGLGGQVEEFWSRPAAGSMIGMFRLIQKDKVAFSEFEQIVEQDGSLIFKVKHFAPTFVGWEEKDKCVEFRFLSASGNEVRFDGLTLIKIDDNTCKHVLSLRDKATGKSNEVEIVYRRTKD